MASKSLVDIALKLAKQLGANTNKFLGSRTNIIFLGKGPQDDLLFQSDINTEALGAIPLSKGLPQIESSMGYLTGGKLNDIQANKLIENMTKMKEFHFPTQTANIIDMGTGTRNLTPGGLEYLRLTGRAGKKVGNVSDELAAAEGVAPEETILPTGGLMGRIEGRMKNIKDAADEMASYESPSVGEVFGFTKYPKKQVSNEIEALETMTRNKAGHEFITGYVDEIYKNAGATSSVDVPKKRAAAREFLYNMLKKETDLLPPGKGGTLESVVSAEDYKYITEGGGGALGDPLVLVKKYFGDEIAKRIPLDSRVEVIDAFVDNVRFTKDNAGRLTNDPRFNPDDLPDFADGGIARLGFKYGSRTIARGALAFLNKNKKNSEYMIKASDNVSPGYAKGDTKYNAELLAEQLADDAGVVYDDLDHVTRSEFYGTAYNYLAQEMGMMKKLLSDVDESMARQALYQWDPGKGRKPSAHGGLAKILEV